MVEETVPPLHRRRNAGGPDPTGHIQTPAGLQGRLHVPCSASVGRLSGRFGGAESDLPDVRGPDECRGPCPQGVAWETVPGRIEGMAGGGEAKKPFSIAATVILICIHNHFQCYEVRANTGSLMRMERSATCLFGIRNYGVHINGFVRHPEAGLCVWLQQRSKTKQTWPGEREREGVSSIRYIYLNQSKCALRL